MATEKATLGGGCFWCLEAAFLELDGVLEVHSGYAGGHVPAPSYHAVCSGTTGHAEVVQVSFDPARITFDDLLGVFFTIHDPTTLNRQGNDVGRNTVRSSCTRTTRRRTARAPRSRGWSANVSGAIRS